MESIRDWSGSQWIDGYMGRCISVGGIRVETEVVCMCMCMWMSVKEGQEDRMVVWE